VILFLIIGILFILPLWLSNVIDKSTKDVQEFTVTLGQDWENTPANSPKTKSKRNEKSVEMQTTKEYTAIIDSSC
jgi:hypothetical protein